MLEDEEVPDNDTAAAFIRKLEDGTFLHFAGGELQALLQKLRATAARRGARVTGEFTIKVKIPMGKDGYALPVASVTTKAPQMARGETMIFVGEDGDLMSRPVEKQLTMKGIDGGAKPASGPATPASKNL